MVNDTPWCVRFSHSSYIGKLSGISGGPGEGGVSGVWCCGTCEVRLSSATLSVSSSLFLRSGKSQICNSNSSKSNTHSLPQNPVDSMWSVCSANSEPVTLSIKYVLVPKALSRYWISMTNPSLPSGVCLSNDYLLTILLILEFFLSGK